MVGAVTALFGTFTRSFPYFGPLVGHVIAFALALSFAGKAAAFINPLTKGLRTLIGVYAGLETQQDKERHSVGLIRAAGSKTIEVIGGLGRAFKTLASGRDWVAIRRSRITWGPLAWPETIRGNGHGGRGDCGPRAYCHYWYWRNQRCWRSCGWTTTSCWSC